MKLPMKIILIAPKFFGFDQEVLNQFKNLFHSCVLFSEKPTFRNHFFQSLINKLPYRIYLKIFNKYVSKILKFDPSVNIVLIIRAEYWNGEHLQIMKNSYPNAKFYLYQWDSLANLPNLIEQIPFFDKVFTFDPEDAKKLNIIFKPLFFKNDWNIDLTDKSIFKKKFKVAFIGSDYGDRYDVLFRFKTINQISDDDFFCHLYRTKSSFLYNKYLRKSDNYFPIKYDYQQLPLDEKDVFLTFQLSNVILDINPQNQIGLSARTLEALAANKKLITTNKFIIEYDFYDPRNIFIIDRDNLLVPNDFFESTYIKPNPDIIFKYSSIYWLKDFLN
jgi:hypothetical protein